MNAAQELINAIQSCKPGLLRLVIARLQRQAGIDLSRVEPAARHRIKHNPVNAQLAQVMNLTPMHVAAKAYSAHEQDPDLASAFSEMVEDLLAAGANPWIEATRPHGTVAEVCEGRLPPALAQFFEDHCDDRRTSKQDAELIRLHPTTVARIEARREAWRERNPRGRSNSLDELRMLNELEEEENHAAFA